MSSPGELHLSYIVVGSSLITGGLRVHVAEGGDALALPKQLSVPVAIADNLLNEEAAEATNAANLEHSLEQGDDLGLDTNAEDSDKGDLSQVSSSLICIDRKSLTVLTSASVSSTFDARG